MAATALAIGAAEALRSVETTVLLTVEDTLSALSKAILDQISTARGAALNVN
jgi:hypothetical protein